MSARRAHRTRALTFVRWFDSWAGADACVAAHAPLERRVDWLRCLPFIAVHLACVSVFFVGASAFAVWTAVALYFVRMFAVTAFYHRYFSHRAFRTSRAMQFVFALVAGTAAQRGPLWWAAHHRAHHRSSDTERDPHSPDRQGFWWSHCGWFTSREHFHTRVELVRDLARYPELVFLDRFDVLVPLIGALAVYGAGALLARVAPELGTNGPQLLAWSVVSTVVLYHATFSINSLAHRFGRRVHSTADSSRNSFWLALLTLGEGWHNNHHRYQASVRQGWSWWELDPSWWVLWVFARLHLVSHLKPVPAHVRRSSAAPRK